MGSIVQGPPLHTKQLQQTGELFLAPAKKRESLGEQTVPGTVPGTDYAVSGIMRLDW